MKWTGTNEQRKSILDRYLRSGIEGLFEGGASRNVGGFIEKSRPSDQETSAEGRPTADSGRAGGNQGTRAGVSLASRARAVVEAIAGLSDQQLKNLGLMAIRTAMQKLKTRFLLIKKLA